jgi:hypothetical protein
MPLFGVSEIAPWLDHAPVMESLLTETELLPSVEVLQAMFEIDDRVMLDLLPKALHPTIPPTVTFVFWRCQEGPLGAFNLAQVRVGCRAGVRPRGFLAASYCDSETASQALRSRWGLNCRPGIVRLRRHYDRITGSVVTADETVLQVALADPQAISGADAQYVASMHLARVRGEDAEKPLLVQVDPEYTFRRADRGRPVVEQFAPAAWAVEGLKPVYAVSSTMCVCDITLPHIRYTVDPDVPAMQGTKTVRR